MFFKIFINNYVHLETLKHFKMYQWSLIHKFSFSLCTILVVILTIFLILFKCIIVMIVALKLFKLRIYIITKQNY